MAAKKVEFEITIEKLSIKFKGDIESGQVLQAGVNRIVDGITHAQNEMLEVEEGNYQEVDQPVLPAKVDSSSDKKPKNRKRRSSGDTTVGQHIVALGKSGFFKDKREGKDIKEALSQKGHNYELKNVAAALTYLTQQEVLQRERNGNKNWIYWEGPKLGTAKDDTGES